MGIRQDFFRDGRFLGAARRNKKPFGLKIAKETQLVTARSRNKIAKNVTNFGLGDRKNGAGHGAGVAGA
jgi:hypothetical protein